MARCHEAVHDRVNNIVMRGEKFAASCGDFNSNPVFGGDERPPRLRHVRLPSCGENKPIHHLVHYARVRFVIFNCVRIVHRVHDRRSRSRLWRLAEAGRDGAKENESYVSHEEDRRTTANGFYE